MATIETRCSWCGVCRGHWQLASGRSRKRRQGSEHGSASGARATRARSAVRRSGVFLVPTYWPMTGTYCTTRYCPCRSDAMPATVLIEVSGRLVDDLGALAEGLSALLDSAHWQPLRRHVEIQLPYAPLDLFELAETLLADSGNEIDEPLDVVDAWLSRPDAMIEVEVLWDGCCTSSATTVRRVPDHSGRVAYFVLCPDEDVGGPEVFARTASPTSVLSRFRVLNTLFRSAGSAFGIEPGPFRTGAITVTDPALAAFSSEFFRS